MKNIYCIICGKYIKFKNPEIFIFDKTLFLSIIYGKCGIEAKKYLKKKNRLRY